MSWTAYQVTLRLHSPMHVGWRKLGNLQQTRPYLTGRTLWGALTARITRELGGKDKDYGIIGRKVDEQLAFTYFYPSVETDPEKLDLWPWSNQWDMFAWTFLGSYASTAITEGHSAEEGSLHETEYIAPYARKSKADRDEKKVYLVGYIFEKAGCEFISKENGRKCRWQDILGRLQLGGERGYGWGRVSVASPGPVECEACFSYDLNCDGTYPIITVPKGEKVLAHTDTEGLENSNIIEGTIDPLIGRETGITGGFGAQFPQAKICWIPGSIVRPKQPEELKEAEIFQIGEKGIWQHLPS